MKKKKEILSKKKSNGIKRIVTGRKNGEFMMCKKTLQDAFTKGKKYKVISKSEWQVELKNNQKIEHYVTRKGWLRHFYFL
jgi:hypothetical protein